MVTLTGIGASTHQNEQVAETPPPTDYYVAHLFLLPDEPGPDQATPFYFASVDLCALAPYMQVALDTLPSAHGYTRHFHRYNYAAALLHRFSYYLIPCYVRNFDQAYAEAFGTYLAKVVYVPPRVPLKILGALSQSAVRPIVVAGTSECETHARKLGFPCSQLEKLTPDWLNREIGACFSKAAQPLTDDQKARMDQGQLDKHIPPNVLVATFPDESLFGQSNLNPFPTSGLRLLLPNEALNNQLRRRWMPPVPKKRSDPAKNLERAIWTMRIAFAQRLSDYLLEDLHFGLADDAMAPELRSRLEKYVELNTAEAYEELVYEASQHLTEYPGACNYILCCPAINRKSSERIFRRAVPDRILKLLYKAKAQDFLTYARRDEFRSQEEHQAFMALMMYQGLENSYLSTVLALYATTYREPVLRTPQLSSSLFGKLRQLRQTYAGHNWPAFLRDLEKFSNALSNELAPQAREFLTTTKCDKVKFISDLPLEWVPFDGVPVMFQRTVSRLPLTPGNAPFAHLNDSREDLWLGSEETQRVLICNCLSPGDRLNAYAKIFVQDWKVLGYAIRMLSRRALKNMHPHCFPTSLTFSCIGDMGRMTTPRTGAT